MKLKKIMLISLLALLGSTIFLFITYTIINSNTRNWANSLGYEDKTVKKIDLSGNSIKAAFKHAKSRTDQWHEGGILQIAIMHFHDRSSLEIRKGELSCSYQIINNDPYIGYKYISCLSDFDFRSSEMTSFAVTAEQTGVEYPYITEEEISKWVIDIDDVFNLTEELVGNDYLNKFDDPRAELLFYRDHWRFTIIDKKDPKRVSIDINPLNRTAKLMSNDLDNSDKG